MADTHIMQEFGVEIKPFLQKFRGKIKPILQEFRAEIEPILQEFRGEIKKMYQVQFSSFLNKPKNIIYPKASK
jgi:uncharacterized protein YukE